MGYFFAFVMGGMFGLILTCCIVASKNNDCYKEENNN